MDSELKVFEGLVSKEEEVFLENVLASRNDNFNHRVLEANNVFATFYLAKQMELSSKSNDKNAIRMFWLTIAIAFLGACQVAVAVLGIFNK